MKSLVFDTSAIISIATNNLLWVLKPLREKFQGDFFISNSVKKEIVDVPLKIKRYKLEAIRLEDSLSKGDFKFFKNINLSEKTKYLLNTANSIFESDGEYIHIVDEAEVESLVLANALNSDAYVIDERTVRLLVEDPRQLLKLFSRKLKNRVNMNRENLSKFQSEIKNVKVIRSAELMVIAFELGLFNIYKDSKQDILDGLLWGLKLRGCSISDKEIEEILQLEKFK